MTLFLIVMGETELFHDTFKRLTDVDKVTLGQNVERMNFEKKN